MKLLDIYDQYSIPNNLQTHMLRVAGVGKIICDNLSSTIKIDRDLLVRALCVHDMGNIVKFDFTIKSIYTNPDTISKLKIIQSDFIAKFGHDAHEATENILKEVGLENTLISLINGMIIEELGAITSQKDWVLMIATYADYRVAPHGIVSIHERLDDLVTRLGHKSSSHWSSLACVDSYRKSLKECEEIIQKQCSINLININNQAIVKYINDFPSMEILKEY